MTGGNHLATKSMVQLFNEWEIQLLVLVSFTIQFFLFFAGSLRRRIRNSAMRSLMWLAYLGADVVAAYVLGLISRQEVSTHHLAFFWAPFLLIHLGGQDTITAFAIEDNTLWRRHLLNLVVQASLTLYIFWKSFDGGPNMQLLAPSILLFITGSLRNVRDLSSRWDTYLISPGPVSSALSSADLVRTFFTGLNCPLHGWAIDMLRPDLSTRLFEIMEIQLGLMYDDIYTKALVLRTWGCTILRCISHLSFLAAFVLFSSVVRNKEERWHYISFDAAITYGLFFGGFSLEVSSVCIIMMSPRSCACLDTRHCSFLGSIITRCRRPRKRRVLWSNSMGQFNMLNYLGQYDRHSSKSMSVIRKLANVFCRTAYQKLWISKQVDTKFVEVDEHIMRCVVQRIAQYRNDGSPQQQWPTLGPLLGKLAQEPDSNFDCDAIIILHVFTEVQLSTYVTTAAVESEPSDASVRGVCRMISQYMFYLLVTHPEMLPIRDSDQSYLASVTRHYKNLKGADVNDIQRRAILYLTRFDLLSDPPEECTEAQLLEIREAWVGLLLHVASKSRPEMHAALLASGGELLTFIWLLMAHYGLGDVHGCPIEMMADRAPTGQRHYAF
ncbi:hypothetical protein VPH35_094687 [Triticum aestivum]